MPSAWALSAMGSREDMPGECQGRGARQREKCGKSDCQPESAATLDQPSRSIGRKPLHHVVCAALDRDGRHPGRMNDPLRGIRLSQNIGHERPSRKEKARIQCRSPITSEVRLRVSMRGDE